MENHVYIVSCCRTAIGSFMGQFANISAVTLGATVIEEALKRAKIEAVDVDEVLMGQVLTAGAGQNPARQAAVLAGVPNEVPAYTINMLCGSGLKAVYNAYNTIKAKEASIIICGGMENMSMAKHCFNGRNGRKLGSFDVEDTILLDGLTDPILKLHMGSTAEYLANTHDISRLKQDNFALASHEKAQKAIVNNYLRQEIVTVKDSRGNSIEVDQHVRPNTTIEALSKLKPAFQTDGSVTAGNSSGINDGAAALVVCNANALVEKNLKPLGRIIGFVQVGLDPMEMGLGPIKAVQKLIEKVNWGLIEVDLFEINEAFAVQSIAAIQALNIDATKVNISGGAIALGHPIGCSGARVLITLLYNLLRTGKTKGIAALCIGGGMGIAVAVEVP